MNILKCHYFMSKNACFCHVVYCNFLNIRHRPINVSNRVINVCNIVISITVFTFCASQFYIVFITVFTYRVVSDSVLYVKVVKCVIFSEFIDTFMFSMTFMMFNGPPSTTCLKVSSNWFYNMFYTGL